jgi:hypothetical protein
MFAERGISLVYGGSNVGLMGEIADASLKCGGEVIGVITEELNRKVGHGGLSKLHVVATMHERKTMMFQLSDAYVALPGGLGTIEEVMEMLTWGQLGIHSKPVGFLNVRGYFDHLLKFLDHAVDQRFVKKEHRDGFIVSGSPNQILVDLEAYQPSIVDKWMDRH